MRTLDRDMLRNRRNRSAIALLGDANLPSWEGRLGLAEIIGTQIADLGLVKRNDAALNGINRHGRRRVLLLIAAVAFVAWKPGIGSSEVPQGWEEVQARKKANVAAQLLISRLQAELTAAIENGGAAKAMAACRTVAQGVTADLSKRDGVVVRRTALRVRNPANRPDTFERAWLEEATRTVANGGIPTPTYQIVEKADVGCELRHMRAILFPGGVCSQCHGRDGEISSSVRRYLRQHYPKDEATGFAPGDLSGAISVQVVIGAPCGTGSSQEFSGADP